MDEMKSALERAMERADRMGKLSPEEMQKQHEARYFPIGEAIAQRFFEHGYISVMAEQLGKIEPEGKGIATRAALATLIDGIDLENDDFTEKSLAGILGLRESKDSEKIAADIRNLLGQYSWQKKLLYEENSAETGKEVKERMAAAGISGSAIAGINLENDELWGEKLYKIRSEFESLLKGKKKELF